MTSTSQPVDITPTVEISWPAANLALVALGGEHDLASAPSVERAIDDALRTCSHLVIDLSEVQFIDSSHINLLVRTKNDADERGCAFSLVLNGDAPSIERTLEICGVLPVLNRVPTVAAALALSQDSAGRNGTHETLGGHADRVSR